VPYPGRIARLGRCDLDVFPLCLGGNVFGWAIDEQRSFAVLDAYAAAGGNFLDTADVYSAWVPGNRGGESEAIIGRWVAARANRGQLVIATKVGTLDGVSGLSARSIRAGAEASLRRLQIETIDLYYAHRDDPQTPIEETLRAFDELVREGKVRHIGASNFSAPRLAASLALSEREALAAYVVVQPAYNLLDRDGYEGELADLCVRRELACVPYFGLARGFLSGKYRRGAPLPDSPRAASVRDSYLNDRGFAVLAVLDAVAAAHSTFPAAVALAWLRSRPAVVAPIVSATSPAQVAELVASTELVLSAEELELLTEAGI
jgi:aryl-alcohol dehydrogenase-like predicted oxidoreductase